MTQVVRPETVDFGQPFVYVSLNNTTARADTFAEAKRFFIIPGRIHLVMLLSGDDTPQMLAELERELYPFDTVRSALYHCRVFGWQELGWAIVSVPARDEERVQNFLATHNRQLAKNQMFTAHTREGTDPFPFTGEQFRLVRKNEGILLTLTKK